MSGNVRECPGMSGTCPEHITPVILPLDPGFPTLRAALAAGAPSSAPPSAGLPSSARPKISRPCALRSPKFMCRLLFGSRLKESERPLHSSASPAPCNAYRHGHPGRCTRKPNCRARPRSPRPTSWRKGRNAVARSAPRTVRHSVSQLRRQKRCPWGRPRSPGQAAGRPGVLQVLPVPPPPFGSLGMSSCQEN